MQSAALIVVGAGQASAEMVTAVRHEGYTGRIQVIGAEPQLPYHRPPLSKAYLAGTASLDSLMLKAPATYDKADIEFVLDTRVEEIDRARKHVVLSDGRSLPYQRLALNLGGHARPLSIDGVRDARELGNFHYVRTIGDIDRLRGQLAGGVRLVIIGGGYIGLEIAAVAVQLGAQVTVLEAAPRVLARVTAPELSEFYQRVHREAGVDVRTGVSIERFELSASTDTIAAIICRDGESIAADIVVAGVGLIPNTQLASDAGLAIDNGIVVDEFGRTSDPDIVAAGDCANHPSAFYGRRVRLESVPNAIEQARSAAAIVCGRERPYDALPWFWSDQYDLKLQMVGLSQGYDQLVVRGSTSERSFAVFYLQQGRVIAVDAVKRPQEFMVGKKLVAGRIAPDPRKLADMAVPAKELLQP